MSKRNADGTSADDVTDAAPLPRPPGEVTDDNPPADDPPSDAPGSDVPASASKRPAKRPASKSAAQRSTPKKSTPTRPTPAKSAPSSSTSGRPMTAADYARTTSTDPAATSVFPAVSDDPEPAPTQPQAAVASESATESAVTRQARLSLVHVDPWSVTQLAFVVSTALMIVAVVAVTVFWLVLNVTGVWNNLNDTINSVLSSEDGTFDVENYLGFGRVVGLTLVLSAINVVLMTALAAVGARLYNAATHLVGGVQVTFRERG